jgi:hypothetical protein
MAVRSSALLAGPLLSRAGDILSAPNVYHYHSIRSIGLCQWYINITIRIVDIIHRPVLYLITRRSEDWILSPSSGETYSNGPISKS